MLGNRKVGILKVIALFKIVLSRGCHLIQGSIVMLHPYVAVCSPFDGRPAHKCMK